VRPYLPLDNPQIADEQGVERQVRLARAVRFDEASHPDLVGGSVRSLPVVHEMQGAGSADLVRVDRADHRAVGPAIDVEGRRAWDGDDDPMAASDHTLDHFGRDLVAG